MSEAKRSRDGLAKAYRILITKEKEKKERERERESETKKKRKINWRLVQGISQH